MTRITNEKNTDPMLLAADLLFGGPGAIERMEARGQRELVNSDSLPSDTRGKDADFVALGFTFGEPDASDPMFRPATLPKGWKREASSHAMWSYLLDERGIRRVSIFYKAAFYDRSAHMHINNVGHELANDAFYNIKGERTRESLKLDSLTDVEAAQFRECVEEMRANIERAPHIYGDCAERLAAVDKILAAKD
jgi:hypothetical protein